MDGSKMIECSCQGNNPDCYKCGGKGYLTKKDLIPDYKKFSYPSHPEKTSKVTHNPKDYKKPVVPSVIRWLEMKELNNKYLWFSKKSQSAPKRASKNLTKKKRKKGQNDKSKIESKFIPSENNPKNHTTTWSPDQLLLLDRIKENIKFMEPHYKANKRIKAKGNVHQNYYVKRGKNLSGTVYKNKPLYDDKIDHKLDGGKDYYQYREHGKYGSHPEFDDMGDESNP
ncbi:MAG: hypothetical protein U0X39_08305 [Bacteroidales bacterium]